MAIPLTNLHQQRVVDQIRQNVIGVQRDMLKNAMAHRLMAQAQAPALGVLQTFVSDCATDYLKRLTWVSDLRANPTREAWVLAACLRMGWTEADIVDVVAPLFTAANGLKNAPRTTYGEIISACDSLIAFVDVPPSLWPE